MNKIKQQIAIAEACPAIFEINNGRYKLPFFIRYRASGHECDPLNDLNSMHAAEKVLPDGHTYWEFIRILDDIVKHGTHVDYVADRASANAAQRAEAFLRTIGKWENE